jgi:hypothetical protein
VVATSRDMGDTLTQPQLCLNPEIAARLGRVWCSGKTCSRRKASLKCHRRRWRTSYLALNLSMHGNPVLPALLLTVPTPKLSERGDVDKLGLGDLTIARA